MSPHLAKGEIGTVNYETLRNHVAGGAVAYRLVTELEPVGGANDKVFPPTYSGENRNAPARYALETDADGNLASVLLDSAASQANRAELALRDALDAGDLNFPAPFVDFAGCADVNFDRLSVLEAPHRIADAIFRDSELGGEPFRVTEIGREIFDSSVLNAMGVYKHAPTSLLFGVWDSTGPRGGGGMKFQRAYVSEIMGHYPQTGVKVSSRIDPLGIRGVPVSIPKERTDENMWELDPKGKKNAADINHSNIPPSVKSDAGGVYIKGATRTATLSLAALRKLRFKGRSLEAQISARTALAALGMATLAYQAQADCDLRSRCLLIPTGPSEFKAIARDRAEDSDISVDADSAAALLKAAVERCQADGVAWSSDDLTLVPSQKLLDLIAASRALAPGDGN